MKIRQAQLVLPMTDYRRFAAAYLLLNNWSSVSFHRLKTLHRFRLVGYHTSPSAGTRWYGVMRIKPYSSLAQA
jgi:hypothetical protein